MANRVIEGLQGTPMESATKHVHKTKLDQAVFKATQSKQVPPKAKHERSILNETWNARTSSHVFAELFKRPLGGKDIVLYKTCVVIHKMLRDGHPQCLEDAYTRRDFLEALKSQLTSIPSAMSSMDEAYLGFLLDKIIFHKAHPEVGGEISLNKFKEKSTKLGVKQSISITAKLLELQKGILSFQQKALQSMGLNECRLCGLVPCLAESYGIYNFVEYLLGKLVDADADVDKLIDMFETQFPLLQKFYFNCSTIPYISSQINVPKLTKCPQFKKSEKRERKPKQDPNLINPIINPNLLGSGSGLLASGGLLGSGSGQNMYGNPNMMGSGMGYSGFGTSPTGYGSSFGNNPFASSSSLSAAPQANPFLSSSMQPYQPPTSSIFGQDTSANGLFSSDPFSNTSNIVQQNLQPNYPPGESKEDLEKKIRELESRALELEQQIRDVDGQNNEIKQLLNERESGLESVNKQMEERLSLQQSQFGEAHNALKSHLDRVVQKYETEKSALVQDQLEFAKKGVEQAILRFDDPQAVGNRGASTEDILRVVNQVQEGYSSLLNNLESQGDTVGASRTLSDRTGQFVEDIKGALCRIHDPNIKGPLSENSKNTVLEVARMLGHALQLSPQGKPDERQMVFLKGEQTRFNNTIEAVKYYIQHSAQYLKVDTHFAELEALAERELANAAKIVEESTQALRQRKTQIQGSNTPNSEVASTLIDAVLAITNGTQLLVKASVTSQQERVKKETSGLMGEGYHRDPMWTEALIAAAKAVADATKQLVTVAFQSTMGGKIDDIALTNAAKAVAAATAQLVAASRKGEGDSQTQQALDNAAAAITRATRALVDAAKSFSNAEEMEIMKKSDLFASAVKAEILQQTKILRHEKELDLAKKQLVLMKRQKNQ